MKFGFSYLYELIRANKREADASISTLSASVASGGSASVRILLASDTVQSTDGVLVCNSTSEITIKLPVATGSGRSLIIANVSTGNVIIDGDNADVIDGETTQTIGQYETISILDYITNKWKIT